MNKIGNWHKIHVDVMTEPYHIYIEKGNRLWRLFIDGNPMMGSRSTKKGALKWANEFKQGALETIEENKKFRGSV